VRVFLAGASGVIGIRLIPLLTQAGHVVAGMTRTPGKAGEIAGLGAEPVVCDVFDLRALGQAVTAFSPDVVLHQLTDLPDDIGQLAAYGGRNARIRAEGTRNLVAAAADAGARVIAQSISWELPNEAGRAVTAAHERMVLAAGGVVIRYGQFYGPGTYYPGEPPAPPRVHVDSAARQTMPALDVAVRATSTGLATTGPATTGGITIVADDRAEIT
jgi:nucleoside-diphosphate-sugar epimerase